MAALQGDIASVNELQLFHLAMRRALREEAARGPILDRWDVALDYLRATMAHASVEQFRVLYLDVRNQLIADELESLGTIDATPFPLRETIGRALQLGAVAMVAAHNHPSGNPSPSQSDINVTRHLNKVATSLGICLHDHIIMGREGHFSMKSAGLI